MKIELINEKRLDEVVFEHYGDVSNFDLVLEANPKLATMDILPIGTIITLPVIEKKSNIKEVPALWD